MRSVLQFLFGGLSALSMSGCGVTVGLWIRSYRTSDFCNVWQAGSTHVPPNIPGSYSYRFDGVIMSHPGCLGFERWDMPYADAFKSDGKWPFERPCMPAESRFSPSELRWEFLGVSHF